MRKSNHCLYTNYCPLTVSVLIAYVHVDMIVSYLYVPVINNHL